MTDQIILQDIINTPLPDGGHIRRVESIFVSGRVWITETRVYRVGNFWHNGMTHVVHDSDRNN